MKIVTTFHQPSSVFSSVRCQLSSRDLDHLVVAKLNRIDVYSLQPNGLQHECGLEIWGKVLVVKAVPVSGSSRSNLLLMLAHPDPTLVFLTYTETESGSAELVVKKQLSLYERSPRQAEFYNDVLVHPSGNHAVVSCYAGKLKIINLKGGNYSNDFDVSLPELSVFGLAFLPVPDGDLSLAILHLDYQERVQLLARDINVSDLELSPYHSSYLSSTSISSKILPSPTESIPLLVSVPPPEVEADAEEDEENFIGGVMIVGGRKVVIFEMTKGQARKKGKRRRVESNKASVDLAEVEKSKEKEREGRKRKPRSSVEWPWGDVTAICTLDHLSLRYFIGDAFGRLSMLSADHLKDQGLILIPLGETSPPTTLTYLTTQALYVGSHLGDSQVIQISQTPLSNLTIPTLPIPPSIKLTSSARLGAPSNVKGKGRAVDDAEEEKDCTKGSIIGSEGSFISVLEMHKNIAPIVDAVLADTDGSGQPQIVTCSGGANTGSLNVVRNGADFQELASIPGLTNITNVWSVREKFENSADTGILVSSLQTSHIFQLHDSGRNTTLSYTQEHPTKGLTTNQPTLAFGNVAQRVIGTDGKATYVNSQLVVQVTPKGALLLGYDEALGAYVRHAEWDLPGKEVVAASVNASQVLLALNGGLLVALSIAEGKTFKVVVWPDNSSNAEISTVSCVLLDPLKRFSSYITISYWESNIVDILLLDPSGFISVSKTQKLPALVRSAFLYNFGSDRTAKGNDYHPYLLIGLGDGSLVSFSWKDKQLKDKKIISLGHAPVSLTPCQVDGKRTVFAAGNRATVLSWEKKRLHNSPIMLKEVVGASALNTKTFPSSLILGTAKGLFIGRVRDLDKMHIRSVSFGLDNPRRLAYEPTLKVFGVACTRTEPSRVGDLQVSSSSFKLLDNISLSTLSNFNCAPEEEITALTAYSPSVDGNSMSLFCLGTYLFDAEEKEPTNGRLLIFTAYQSESPSKSSSLQLSMVASTDVKGCVYALTIVGDLVVAAVNSAVRMYHIKTENGPASLYSLELLSEWNHNYFVTSLASYGDYIVVGDQISSVSLLKVSNAKIQNIARDYGPLWPVCVEASNEENIIGANDALNLFTFTLTHTLGRSLLERDGGYHLTDFVTKFIRGSLTPMEAGNHILHPNHIFFTASGRIGVIVDVADGRFSLALTALQRNLGSTIKGVGEVDHTKFRTPKTTRGRSDADAGSFGFIDGDFLEQFLTYLGMPEQLDKIISGQSDPERLTMSIEEMQTILETLQSMH
ncbi:CPSF A subunit region-domain-containing protein [Collybia nuda]|uniref:CPSF A subunit region-domain-containing protein n=1 Tax=Collybia nuda TaxID=64659 RepID=A0A9P5Y6B4_9AGAR|nr:CPSF A subunit region-domain-containing protein [Collybia nuda]